MGHFELILAVRLAKFLAIALFLAGLAAVFAAETLAAKKKAVGVVLAPGFLLTWALGFALATVTETRLLAGFTLYTLAASFVALQAALFYGLKEGRSRTGPMLIAALGVGLSFFFMVFRHLV